ncbi:sodium:solute symporter family transporter [Dyadobacter sp. LHD-138]|uniref:SLC5 family protein n=1 Tax=Dyadobacter sp. LHD-138 TaxID=3071413 RepID=UPI0027DF0224|nr:sodium/solute symporter [Dyadobacter sp. LHD-138]MDQ6479459.1 sodium/solute symporter [Dyadobacter sp. LHD-138]
MAASTIDMLTVVGYFILILGVGLWSGRGKKGTAANYFVSKGTLPFWAIGAAYVASGLNPEQLIGMNGMGYMVGLPLVNSYLIAIFVYSALIFCFFPIYLRNNIMTMPQYLGMRFDLRSQNVFSVLLLVSYILLNLSVVLYGGAKLFHGIYGVPIWLGVLVLGVVAGMYTMYGGMKFVINAAVFDFVLVLCAGAVLFVLGYIKLPNGWSDIKAHAPGGFHLMQPMDYPVMPWHAVLFALFNLQLFYSCINQSLVQRGLGARSEWDVKMAIILAAGFVLLRPFIEIFPGMIARALALTGHPEYEVSAGEVDSVYPMLIKNLIPDGLKGLLLIGALATVMSTTAALLNSISTLFTYDVYKKWINTGADDKKLVRVGIITTLVLMVFSILYAPVIENFGGIFLYFQAASTYLAVPVATCFLFGIFWKGTTPAAAFAVMVAGIPLGAIIQLWIIPTLFSADIIKQFGLANFYVIGGITQIFCALLIVLVSLVTKPKDFEGIKNLMWSPKLMKSPEDEPGRPLWQSVWVWWGVMVVVYALVYYMWW